MDLDDEESSYVNLLHGYYWLHACQNLYPRGKINLNHKHNSKPNTKIQTQTVDLSTLQICPSKSSMCLKVKGLDYSQTSVLVLVVITMRIGGGGDIAKEFGNQKLVVDPDEVFDTWLLWAIRSSTVYT